MTGGTAECGFTVKGRKQDIVGLRIDQPRGHKAYEIALL